MFVDDHHVMQLTRKKFRNVRYAIRSKETMEEREREREMMMMMMMF